MMNLVQTLTIEDNDVDTVDNHGDTRETATTLTLTVDTTVSGRIDPADDVDYFRIDISTTRFVTIYTTGDLDTIGRLLDNMGDLLQGNDQQPDFGQPVVLNNFRIHDRLAQGTYYIEVASFNSNFIGPYTLHVLTDDHSPTTDRATVLSLDTPEPGRIEREGNVDYFSLEIDAPTDVNIFTTGNNLNTIGRLINSVGTELTSDDQSGTNDNFLIRRLLERGTYYIEVSGSGTETGDYRLRVDTVGDDVLTDHGDTRETATTLTLTVDTSVSGRIDPADDVDYFRIDISTTIFVDIFTTGNLDTIGRLLDNTGNLLQNNDQQPDAGQPEVLNNFRIHDRLGSGTYYIEVTGFNSNSTENYTLYVLTDDHSPTTDRTTVLSLNTTVSGTIEREGNVDYFSLEILEMDAPTDVNIFTTGGLNTVGRLINSVGTELTSDDQSGTNDNFLIRRLLERGTYYIEVSGSGTETGNYDLRVDTVGVDDVAPQISLIIPSTLTESTNEIDGFTMIDVKHGEPFPVYISVDAFADIPDSLLLTLDGPQDGALPPTLMTSALGAGATWSELFVGNNTTTAVGQQNYRYCLAGTQNCSSTISVSYSPPAEPIVDVDEISPEWDFTSSDQTATPAGCPPNAEGTLPTLLSQEGNTFTSRSFLTYTGIVDGDSYSLAYRNPNVNGGTYIDTHTTQYSPNPVALSGPGVWWWTDRAGFLCRGTYNIIYTPRPRIDSIAVADMSVSEDVGNVAVTVTLTYPPVQQVVARLEIEGTATDADYQVERDINFGIGERQTTFNLDIVDDNLVELDETIILSAVSQDPNKLVGASSTTLTIEDNDVTATTLTLNSSVSGTIDSAGDVGYFSIVISTTTFVTIYTTGDDLEDTIGTLQNSAGTELAANDDPPGTFANHFLIRARLNPGTYYIRVMGFASDTGNYSIQVDVDSVDDHSDIRFTATEIELSTPVSGRIDPAGDADYFSIVIRTPTFVNIFTTGNDLDTVGRLINSVGEGLASDDQSGTNDNFLIRALLKEGTYYIEVIAFGADDIGDYFIRVDIDGVDDHSDISFTATEIELDTSVSGTIDPAGDTDYFILEILEMDAPTDVNIFTTGNDLDTAGILYDGTNTFLQLDDNSGEGNNFLISDRLEQGTYYIEVGNNNSDSTGNYTLYVLTDDHSPTTDRATVLSLDTPVSGTIEPEGNVDYFSMEIHGDGLPAFNVNIFTTGGLNTVGRLYDGTNTFLQDDDNSGEGNNFLISDRLEQGTYYIEVRSSGTETGGYELHVDVDLTPIAGLEIVGVVGDNIRLAEGDDVTLRVTLDRAFDQDVTIQIETAGTATTADYTITVNPVTLPIGSTSVNTRLMIIRDGDNQEPDETIILTLNADNEQIRDGEPGARLTLTIGARALLFRIKVFLEGAR